MFMYVLGSLYGMSISIHLSSLSPCTCSGDCCVSVISFKRLWSSFLYVV